MATRKTVQVADLRAKVNRMLADSAADAAGGRVALAVMLESVLLDTGNYKGFRFTDGNAGNTDGSRRFYF